MAEKKGEKEIVKKSIKIDDTKINGNNISDVKVESGSYNEEEKENGESANGYDEDNEGEFFEKGPIDPYQKAMAYLSKNDIFDLFQTLTAELVLHRPEESIQFMIKEIDKIRQAKEAKSGSFIPGPMDPYNDPPERKAIIQDMFPMITADNR